MVLWEFQVFLSLSISIYTISLSSLSRENAGALTSGRKKGAADEVRHNGQTVRCSSTKYPHRLNRYVISLQRRLKTPPSTLQFRQRGAQNRRWATSDDKDPFPEFKPTPSHLYSFFLYTQAWKRFTLGHHRCRSSRMSILKTRKAEWDSRTKPTDD